MKRKIKGTKLTSNNRKIDLFISDILKLCKKHKMLISTENPKHELVVTDWDLNKLNQIKFAQDGLFKVLQQPKEKDHSSGSDKP